MMVTQPHEPDPSLNIFTEGINYFSVDEQSIWGEGDKVVVELIKDIPVKGCWLDLASGDGRYSSIIIDRAETLVATDIDRGALSKLLFRNRHKKAKKLNVVVGDITKTLPFLGCVFDGIICTGILHLFSERVVSNIIAEVSRISRPDSHFALDFATDVRRYRRDGTVLDEHTALGYSTNDATDMLIRQLTNFRIIHLETSSFEDNLTQFGSDGYSTIGNFVMLHSMRI